jgi:hypothetical protein
MNHRLFTLLLLIAGLAWHSTIVSAAADTGAADTGAADTGAAEIEAETGTTPAPGSDDDADAEKSDQPDEDFDKRLEALLSEVSAADAYGDPINCLSNRKYRHIDVISEDLLLFSRGNSYWVNELKRSCVGLTRDMVLHTQVRGINSLCENDLMYANRSFDIDAGFTSSGRPLVVRATCSLGKFKPINEVFAQSLKEMAR